MNDSTKKQKGSDRILLKEGDVLGLSRLINNANKKSYIPEDVSSCIGAVIVKVEQALKEQIVKQNVSEPEARAVIDQVVNDTHFPHPGMAMLLEDAFAEAIEETPSPVIEQVSQAVKAQKEVSALLKQQPYNRSTL